MAFTLLGKNSDYTSEYKKFKKAISQNPADYGLKAEFIKFCLLNRFTKHEAVEEHVGEALRMFEAIASADSFDFQCHYLVGKYFQEEKDIRKAYGVYLNAIRRFNRTALKDPGIRADNSEIAYSVALNVMTLQSNPVDPEVEVCFKILRKSFPLHLKRIEFENEMAKPAPDKFRIKILADEIKKLRAEDEKASAAPAEESKGTLAKEDKASAQPAVEKGSAPAASSSGSAAHAKEPKGIFSKLFNELSPGAVGITGAGPVKQHSGGDEKTDSLKMAPPQEALEKVSVFMVYHKDQWEGPYTTAQLKSMGFLESGTWICRMGSQQVVQAYEVPDLQSFFHK